MPELNPTNYFANALQKAQAQQAESPASAKLVELQDATARKLQAFDAGVSQQKAIDLANQNSWVGKLGLDPDSLAGHAVNAAANLTTGAIADVIVPSVAFLSSDLPAIYSEAGLSQPQQEALNRYYQGKATEADKFLINHRPEGVGDGFKTPLQAFQQAAAYRQRGQDMRDAANELDANVYTGHTDALNEAISKNFQGDWDQTQKGAVAAIDGQDESHLAGFGDAAAGVAKLIYHAGEAAANNPKGVFDYITRNAPQLAVGAAGRAGEAAMMLSNIGYASDYYQKGIQNYQAENNGALPDDSTKLKMAAWATSLAAAEHVGNVLELGAAKGAGHAVAEGGKTGLMQSLKNTAHAALEGALEETMTEGYQGYAEGQASMKPASAEDVYQQAVIGGLVGAGSTGGGRAIGEVLKTTPEHAEERETQLTQKAAQVAAIQTGDVSALTNPKSATYDPANAVAALHGNSVMQDATPEIQQANFAKANQVISDLRQRHADISSDLDASTPEAIQGLKDQIAQATADGKVDDAKTLQEVLTSVQGIDRAATQRRVDDLKTKLDQAHENMARFHEDVGSVSDVNEAVQAVSAPIDETDTHAVQARSQAAESIINLSMASPDRLDSETATALAKDTNNGLNDGQRAYLREFTAARTAENVLKDGSTVSQQVFSGGDGNVGIAQYRARIAAAIQTGNQAGAKQQLDNLAKFDRDHAVKADAVAQAWEQGRGTQVIRTKDGQWVVTQNLRPRAELRRNGGLEVNTKALVIDTQNESKAIAAAHKELAAAYALKFSNASQGANYVQDLPQANDQTEDSHGADAPVQGVASPADRTAGSGSDANGRAGQRSGIQASGVTPEPAAARSVVDSVSADDSQASHDAVVTDFSGRSEGQHQSNQDSTTLVDGSDAQTDVQGHNSSESAEQTSDHAQENITEQTGGRLQGVTQRHEDDSRLNLLADNFTQSNSKDGDKTRRPLTAVKDFLSTGWEKVNDFLSSEPTESQLTTLRAFATQAKNWQEPIRQLLDRKSTDFFYEDLTQFLIQGDRSDLDMEENLKTAIAYAGFAYVAEKATLSPINTPEEINGILQRDANETITQEEQDKLGLVGVRQNVVVNALGQKVAQALGLKANKNAPLNLGPKMESALGARVMALLLREGFLERSTLTGTEMQELTGNTYNDNQKFYFLKVAKDAAQPIYEANRGSQGVLDKLFGAEAGLVDPVFDGASIPAQKSIRNTRQKVPKALAKIIAHENAQPNHLDEAKWFVMEGMDRGLMLQIAGSEAVSDASVHKANRQALQAKNDGLARELDNFQDFVSKVWNDVGIDKPIYFQHTVWKQQRVGIANNTVNPQTSKIHRHMLYRPTWETKIDPKNQAQLENFRLRVLEGLGVKTDKQGNEASLSEYTKRVTNHAAIQAAVAAIRDRIAGAELSFEQQQAIVAGVKAGGEDMHSFDALVALAQERQDEPFTVRLMGEVDGVTNGPMLSHLLLGAAGSVKDLFGLLNRGGFFEQGNDHDQYNLWRGDKAAGHFDLYETTALHMTQAMQTMLSVRSQVAPVLNAVYGFTGTLADKDGVVQKAGRNIVKTPLTAMVFGSTVEKAKESMANNFISSIYGAIEDTANQSKGHQSREEIIAKLNTLFEHAGERKLSADMTVQQLMEMELKPRQIAALKGVFMETIGDAIEQTMEADFDDFMKQRRQLNKAAQLSFAVYSAAYTAMRAQLVQELMAKGEIAPIPNGDNKGQPMNDLTAAQEAELRQRLAKVYPVMQTAFSAESGSLDSGLAISKGGRKLSQQASYAQEVKFGEKVDGTKSAGTHAYEQSEIAPGVAMMPMSVHSLDSFISHTAAMLGQVLNVHDAHGAGVGNFQETARNLNQATWKAMLQYSPASEMAAALSRTIVGMSELIEEGNLPPELLANLVAAVNKAGDLQGTLRAMKESAFKADDMKLQALSQMQSIDQYALEGGNYAVTDEDRAEASALRAGLSSDLSSKESEAIARIEAALEAHENGEQSADFDAGVEATDPVSKPSPFGPLGRSEVQSDPALVAFFQANPNATAREVIKHLHDRLGSASGRINEFNAKLLRVLNKTVSPELGVRLVTAGTKESDVLAPPKDAAQGWFVAKGDQSAIYLLSPEFKNSGLTAETVLHELTHGALAQVVQRELDARNADPAYTSEALNLIDELEQLRKQATDYAGQQGIQDFKEALSNIQEFIAYGMTNQAFQRQIISQVSVPSSTGGTGLVNGMKAFVAKLVGILFKGSSKTEVEVATNGMTTLISNVSGLFNQASQEQTKGTAQDLNLSITNNPVGTLNTYSTLDIHEALNAGNITPEFDARLRNLLGGIVQKLHGAFGSLKESAMANQALTPFDVWQKALNTGTAPFAASTQTAPMVISERERHVMEQVEVTVREALSHQEASAKQAYRELRRLYSEMYETLGPADFNSKAEYDFIFSMSPNVDGRSEHLARFAAFGLANQQFNQILQAKTTSLAGRIRDGKTIGERLQIAFEHILQFFHGDLAFSYGGQQAGDKLSALVDKLVDVEAKKRVKLASPPGFGTLIDRKASQVGNAVRQGIADVAGSQWIRSNKNPFIRAAGGLVRARANHQVSFLFDALATMRDRANKETYGVVGGLLNEVRGPGQMLNALQLASTNQQRQRKQIISQTAKFVMRAFLNGGDMNQDTKASISAVLLRTGMHALVGSGRFNMTELENLIGNKTATKAAIDALEAMLTGPKPFMEHMIQQASDLAYFKVTGRVVNQVQMMNAHNIARMYGTKFAGRLTETQSSHLQEVLEQLVPLYALGYTKIDQVQQVKDVLRQENGRAEGGNGIEFTLQLHKRMEEESRDRLFDGQDALMMHGYTPEIYNPHTEVKTANEVDGKELENLGYTKGERVAIDPMDPDQEAKHLYVLKDGGLAPYVTGSISYTGKNAKGKTQHNGYMNQSMASQQRAITAAKVQNGLATGPRRERSERDKTYMAPVVNSEGAIVNWRYLMHESTRDTILERNNDFDSILGSLGGSIYDKETTQELNANVIQSLKDVYDSQKATQSAAFLRVGPGSTDPELREIWKMLPDETRMEIRRVWGGDMQVRRDAITTVFGYRKMSLADAFNKDPALRTGLEQVFVMAMEGLLRAYGSTVRHMDQQEALAFAKRAAMLVTKGERIWQEVMREIKDIIVVKSGVVMLGNIYSNMSLLMLQGVSVPDILKGHLVALRGARDYQANSERLAELQARIDTGVTNGQQAEIEREIATLQDSMARNPVKELIDAGLMPTIAEDQNGSEDRYSYKSELTQAVEGFTKKLNPGVVKVTKTLYLAKDTYLYQSMAHITQLSDFVARYTMYQHLVNRANDPLSKEDAVFQASEAFINYDVPMHKGLQWMDDSGFLMFIKYFLRIQRVLLRLKKDNPGRVLMTVALHHFMSLGPIVLDSDWMTRIGNNPFSWGALQLPSTLPDLASVSSVMRLIK